MKINVYQPQDKIYRTCLANPFFAGAWVIVLMVMVMVVFGPLLAPHDPLGTDLSLRLAPPSMEYPMGNDSLGRCLFSRILVGTRTSIGMGFCVMLFSCVVGTLTGLIAGYQGGFTDELFMRITDVFFSFPEMVAAIAVAGLMGPGTFNLLFALSFVSWMRYARVVRGITLSVREQVYVKSAQLSGVSRVVILFRHIFPASLPSVIVLATIGLAKAVLGVSALGFLGFGVQPPLPEWGTLLMEGKAYILTAPHLSIYPGVCIMVSVMAFNLIGDCIQEIVTLKQDNS
jgi:peptide/nickel transport system permease protein